MKVCVLIDAWEPIWGGGQTYVQEVTKRLTKKYGFKIDIFTRALVSRGRRYVENEVQLGGKLKIFRVGAASSFYNFPARLVWLVTVVLEVVRGHRSDPYDLIHAFPFSAGISGKIISLLIRKPIIFSVFGSHQMDIGMHPLLAATERFILTQIPYNVELTDSRHFLNYPNINRNLKYLPNGVDLARFDKFRAAKRKKNKHFSILWIGKFEEVKGVDFLIYALEKVIKYYPFIHLTLVGYGKDEINVRRLVTSLGLSDNIRFVGKQPLEKLTQYYFEADLFVLPSLAEGQPITVLEAWAAKLPVLVTSVGDNPYLVEEGTTGFLIPPKDVTKLVQAITRAYNHPHLHSLGHQGYKRVKAHFTWDKVAGELKSIYLRI